MAVKVQSLVEYEQNNEIEVLLFADTKDEVSDDMQIDGIPEGKIISYGSSLLTADGDIALLTSDGHWNFVESGRARNLTDLGDIDISTPTDGQVLKYDSSNNKWINATDEGQNTFAGLTDVSVSNLTTGQVPIYNETTNKWENGSIPTELPTVTSDDNGNVLTVVDGAWNKATAPTGEDEVSLTFVEGTMTKPSYMASMSTINFMKELKRIFEKGILALRVGQSSIKPVEYNFPDRYITFIEVSPTITSNSFVIIIYKVDFSDGNLKGSYTTTTLTGA